MNLGLALKLALRELRSGLAGFRVFLGCLALGVAAISGVGSLADAIGNGLSRQGRAILGGDVELRLVQQPADDRERLFLARWGDVSHIEEMRAMARALANDRRTVIELKAVDGAYPLLGDLALDPDQPLTQALSFSDNHFGMVADSVLADRLGLKSGDLVRLGDLEFVFRGMLRTEPDRLSGNIGVGPRVMISAAALAQSGLDQPGSLTSHAYRIRLNPGRTAAALRGEAAKDFPSAGWRIRDPSEATPGLKTNIDRAALFLTLVGLTALMVGGVGVANAVKAHLEGRMRVIAILKCLGANADLIFAIYLTQILIIASIGIVIGLAIGAALPRFVMLIYGDQLPIPAEVEISPKALGLAALYGLLTALAFAIWPLARARNIQPAALFRDLVAPVRRMPQFRFVLAVGMALLGLAALCLATTHDKTFALSFMVGGTGAFILLRAAALGVVAAVRRLPRPRRPVLRLALANIHRPGAATAAVLLSLGLGLSLLVTVAELEGSFATGVGSKLSARAPSFFFVDIQNDQLAAFKDEAAKVAPADALTTTPSLRGRITRVNGIPADDVNVSDAGRWALRGDRGVTYSATPPPDMALAAGQFWAPDYHGPPLITFDADLASAFHIGVGATLTVNVQGREVTGTIVCLRHVDWASGGINFIFIYSPGVFELAPHTHVATLHVAPGDEETAYRRLTDAFPNVTAIRVKEAIESVNAILEKLKFAMLAASLLTVLSGILVLAGALAASQRRRIYEAVILKTIGMTRSQILSAYLLEYLVLGLCAAALGAGIGTAAAYLVSTRVMNMEFTAQLWPLLETNLLALAATIGLGLAGTWAALNTKAASILRSL